VSQEEYEALAAFRSTLRQFLAFSEAAATGAGLTPRQHQALLAVKGTAGPRGPAIGDLARRLGIRHHSAVGLVDRLVALRLLRRQTPGPDHRRVELLLTSRGSRALERLTEAHRDELRQVAPRLRTLLATIEEGPLGPRRGQTAARASRSRRSR
jgi:DNA-binding MarR family transcriptional regulator